MAVENYNTNPDLNTQISGINIAEGCPPSGINNAIRQLMADVKVKSTEQAPTSHAASDTTYGIGTASNYGHVRLSDATDSTSAASDGIAASPAAVKAAFDLAVSSIPVGEFRISYASSIAGYLLCDGAAISRSTYAALFGVIGTKFGAGDGATTFNLPDMRGRVPWGANGNLGDYLSAGLPNISGSLQGIVTDSPQGTGCFTYTQTTLETLTTSGDAKQAGSFVFTPPSIYGSSTTVQPPATALNFFIKY